MTNTYADAPTETALSPALEQSVAVRSESVPAIQGEVSQGGLLATLLEIARDPNVRIDVLTTLAGMQERAEDRQAVREFNAAMSLAQSEIKPVVRDKYNDQTKSGYASLFAVDEVVRPIYLKHGFATIYGFGATAEDSEPVPAGCIRITLTVTHSGGHHIRRYYDAPADTLGPKGSAVKTVLHGIGSTDTYLRNRLLRAAFGIVLRNDGDDDDGNRGGTVFVSQEQEDEILTLLKTAGREQHSFLPRMCTDVRSAAEIDVKDFIRVKGALQEIIASRAAKATSP